MTLAEEKYKDIIHRSWPADPSIFRKHPRMALDERAKIFAPFAALRGHSDRLSKETERLLRSSRICLSDEEAAVLSDKLLQVKRGMILMVTYFMPDTPDGDVGYYVSQTGRVSAFDTIFRTIQLSTGEQSEKGEVIKEIKFDDLLDITDCGTSEEADLHSD
ncbi:MAG: YolD-like family protein [Clostridiales bacterium]|nr:YolD-like family protein [Clostridiales bacterium]